MRNDLDGNAGSPRSGQQSGDIEEATPVQGSVGQEHSESKGDGGHDERTVQLAEIEGLLAQLEPAELEQVLKGEVIVRMAEKNEWIGLLPPPDDFLKYPESVRDHMVAWNDAQILDESKRADTLMNAFLRSKTRGQWMSFLVNVIFTGAALVSFLVTHDAASFGFLALPGINVVFNIWKSRKHPEDSEEIAPLTRPTYLVFSGSLSGSLLHV